MPTSDDFGQTIGTPVLEGDDGHLQRHVDVDAALLQLADLLDAVAAARLAGDQAAQEALSASVTALQVDIAARLTAIVDLIPPAYTDTQAAAAAPVQRVAGRVGDITLTAADVADFQEAVTSATAVITTAVEELFATCAFLQARQSSILERLVAVEATIDGFGPQVTDNGDGTFGLSGQGIADNGDGTYSASGAGLTDNGDGTFTL